MDDVFRILMEDENYLLYYATGSKNFVRDFRKDESKLVRYLTLNKIVLDDKSLNLIEKVILQLV